MLQQLLPCLLATALVTGSLAISLSPGAHQNIAALVATLRPEQAAVYAAIRQERAMIYMWSLGLGLVIGLIYLASVSTRTSSKWSQSCLFVAIVLGVCHASYVLWPKSRYMVTTLDTDEQRQAWVRVYRGMQWRQYSGMVLGTMGLLVYAQYGQC